MFSEQFITNLAIAFEALFSNRLRSLLTALGVIFGVAAVIAMMAIGDGAKQDVLEQIELVGVNNIVITPIFEKNEGDLSDNSLKEQKRKYSPGLTLQDAQSIQTIIPSVELVSPEVIIDVPIVRSGMGGKGRLVGVEPYYFDVGNFDLASGKMFTEQQLINGAQVCVIGSEVRARFFSRENPLGKFIKCGPIWLQVVGVLEERMINDKAISALKIRNYNVDVYTPIQTVLVRYKNRAKIGAGKLTTGARGGNDDDEDDESSGSENQNYHQLDRLTVKVKETGQLASTAEIISRLLQRRHLNGEDFSVEVPELLLKQQERAKDTFSFVIGGIAFLSLLIGGIGIMNIMLASVLERIKEIGLRMALGARKRDIVMQFLFESILLSLSGGVIGVILGIIICYIVSFFFGQPTIIGYFSVFISFLFSVLVGLIFGIMPAKRASEQNPINSLRYE